MSQKQRKPGVAPMNTPGASIQRGSRDLQNALVEDLKRKGYIRTPRVETAFRAIPRHLFVPGVPLSEAYSTRALMVKQTEDGQWISSSSSPPTMAMMLEQLALETGQNVLEIGTGTGYNAALMGNMVGAAGRVTTVEIDADIAATARMRVAEAGLKNVQVVSADGGYGYPDNAPYDRIILTVGAADLLPAWRDQLHPAGRIVLPLSITWSERSIAFVPDGGHLTSLSIFNSSFMRLRGDFPGMTWVQVGPEAGLMIGSSQAMPIDAGQVYRWLTGASKDWTTDLEVTLGEVIFGLELWVSLHKPEVRHVLTAQNGMTERQIVPPLVIGESPKTVTTGVLIGKHGMVALMRPPEQESPFKLIIRQFGSDDTLAQRLLKQVRAWNDAGRPGTKGLRVRTSPRDITYIPHPGEFVVEKPWTNFVLDWPTQA